MDTNFVSLENFQINTGCFVFIRIRFGAGYSFAAGDWGGGVAFMKIHPPEQGDGALW
jgi:hypothetical protein